MSIPPLTPEALRRQCDPAQFAFETTDELETLQSALGQERAMEALSFGIGIPHRGFNLFAFGPTGMGKHYVVRQALEQAARGQSVPSDWCCVYNFDDPHRPRTLELPSGRGEAIKADMAALIEEVKASLGTAFEGDDYRARRRVYEELLKERQHDVISNIEEEAAEEDIAILKSPGGLALVPMEDGEVMGQEAFESLGDTEKATIEAKMERYREQLNEALQQEPLWEREQREKIRELNHEVAETAIGHLVDEVQGRVSDLPEVVEWLDAVQKDVVRWGVQLVEASLDGDEDNDGPMSRPQMGARELERRYRVNILTDHNGDEGAPVVYEDLPTVYNLLGRIEHRAEMGMMRTDFTLIRAGALHRANGGYLIIDAVKLLEQPHAWELLKRALRASEIRTQSIDQLLDRATTVTLEPEPIPLSVKVVLVGESHVYEMLSEGDPDFDQLFKVAVDFDQDLPWTPENALRYAQLIASLGRKWSLRPLDRAAVAQVIEHVSRDAEDNEKLSIHIQSTSDLLREADYWSGVEGKDVIGAPQIKRALEAKRRRSSRVQEKLQENTDRGLTMIATDGGAVGQVNGLMVLIFGQVAFGRPGRITAVVRYGDGEIIDIEREVELGGPLHSKGVLILTGFLGSRYAADMPLSASASIVMEQSYGDVDGDSATTAEMCALLSALSGVPIRQGIAITGSMNQLGQVQAIGGVNEKIEGFFDLCASRGLTGDQGVVIPASNVPNLMLREDVAQAAAEGKFSIYPVKTVDEALTVLTGTDAGELGEDGAFPEGTVNFKVKARLRALAEQVREWS